MSIESDTKACCASSHAPPDTACRRFEAGANGRCAFCDHETGCHPGPGATCEIGAGEDASKTDCGCAWDGDVIVEPCAAHESGRAMIGGQEELGVGRQIAHAFDNELDWRVRNASRRRDVQAARRR